MQSDRNTFRFNVDYFISNISGVISNGKAHINLIKNIRTSAIMQNAYLDGTRFYSIHQ